MSGFMDKVKEAVGSGKVGTHENTTPAAGENYTYNNPRSSLSENPTSGRPNASHFEEPRSGPVHGSEAMNKADPRVGTSTTRDHSDASHVPPSVLSQHVGTPEVQHDYAHDSKTKRHGSVSHQEKHVLG